MITAEDIIRLMAMGYWGAMLLLMLIVWLLVWKLVPKGHKWWTGVLGTAAAAALFVSPMFKQNAKAQKKNQALQIRKEKYLAAKAVFYERCKDAGFKVYRTVENVEGVTLLNVWHFEPRNEDQMWEYAGLPHAFGDDAYIRSFLMWRMWDYQINDFAHHGQGFITNKPSIPPKEDEINRYKYINGFQYVDVLQNQTFQRFQFKNPYELRDISSAAITKPSRYTIEFENPVIPADRAIWLATTKAVIKDSKTGELLGEATWHSLHGGQGIKKYSTTGIWDRARVCPDIANSQMEPIQDFTLKVLKPKQLPQEPAVQTTSDATVAKPPQAQPN